MQSAKRLASFLGVATKHVRSMSSSGGKPAVGAKDVSAAEPYLMYYPSMRTMDIPPSSFNKEYAGFGVLGVMSVVLVAYDIVYPEEEFHGTIPPYPYMRIRNRDFPWGPDGLFESHRHVGVVGEKAHH